MTVRDWNRDEAYFDQFIAGRERLIAEVSEEIERGEVREDRVPAVRYGVLLYLLQTTEASYSRGDPMPEVARRARRALDYLESGDFWHSGGSYGGLRIASLMALVSDDPGEPARLRPLVCDPGREEWAFDVVLGEDPDAIAGEAGIRYYAGMRAVADAPAAERPEALRRQVSLWYTKRRSEYWWGFHRKVDRDDLYFGYWALEYAALARRLGVDDSALEGAKYYPYELAHWLDDTDREA
ncbi:PoNe immunity protein domain-containing protein [Olsenella sp. Marseille-P4559]|uniref:PoNe immunity protein domain-containing protein n=1 Tax=Olsenella sp. Marseille-P4559 TaxID=2364795 RepID=UPI00102FA28D|nr:PoNe immunity protein domain-containing protein [Olsenella sp. Marseille-P4559]